MRIYVDDLEPEMLFTISDPDVDVNTTGVPVTLVGKIDGDVVVNRAPDSMTYVPPVGDVKGHTICQLDWLEGETARAGRMKFYALVEWPGQPNPQKIKPLSIVRIRDVNV